MAIHNRWRAVFVAVALLGLTTTVRGQPQGCGDDEATLDLHNRQRALHGSPPMEWDKELAKGAQAYAAHLASKNCALVHASGNWSGDFGENLAMRRSSVMPKPSCTSPTLEWYYEKENYIFHKTKPYTVNEASGKKTGHFTQLVWADSVKLGCGSAQSNVQSSCTVTVCRYFPAGNYASDDEHLHNVKEFPNSGKPAPVPQGQAPPSQAPDAQASPSPPPAQPAGPFNCSDHLPLVCKDWAARGFCGTQHEYPVGVKVRDQCPVSCEVCVPPEACADRLTYCQDLQAEGYCDPEWTLNDLSVRDVHCALTCGACTGAATPPGPARRFLQGRTPPASNSDTYRGPIPQSEELVDDPDGSDGHTKPKIIPDLVLVGFPLVRVVGDSFDGSK